MTMILLFIILVLILISVIAWRFINSQHMIKRQKGGGENKRKDKKKTKKKSNTKKILSLNVSHNDFCHISQGLKNREIIKSSILRTPPQTGDILEFSNASNRNEKILTIIQEVTDYDSIEECLNAEGYKNIVPSARNFTDAVMTLLPIYGKDYVHIILIKFRLQL
jgi:ASC-1-like (ASCH) protein